MDIADDFRVTVGSPVIAETTWTMSKFGTQELASLPGVAPASRWAAVIGAFQPGTVTRAVIVNPRGVPSTVRVTTIGPSGAAVTDHPATGPSARRSPSALLVTATALSDCSGRAVGRRVEQCLERPARDHDAPAQADARQLAPGHELVRERS